MEKIKLPGLVFAFCLAFFNNQIQASLSEETTANTEIISNIRIIHNPSSDEFKDIIPLYQKYYEKRKIKTTDEVLEGYKELIKLPGFNFIAAFDKHKEMYVGFMNFGHAPDQFRSPEYLYRTILDSAYVENTQEELKIYGLLFAFAEKMSREIKSHTIVAKTGSSDFEQEKRLFNSNMNIFSSPEKERIFYEFYLDQ